ncbi:hypothetical protein CDAR_225631 [Caerostris darwini]|uniref:Uncharacterized protein n=1 Tax=Caerostris darwini TaxID=1538125 RepID=A0AAV4UEC5_9ARAC|nr:hypothetical protein CDAR_225631 [Caerostris darwini]
MFTSTLLQNSGIQVHEEDQMQSGSLGNKKNRVCAQIRQFGMPTLFLTLSAAISCANNANTKMQIPMGSEAFCVPHSVTHEDSTHSESPSNNKWNKPRSNSKPAR